MFTQCLKYKEYNLLVFLLDPTTCKLNIKKLVIAHTIKETTVQRLNKINKVSSFSFLISIFTSKSLIINVILKFLA